MKHIWFDPGQTTGWALLDDMAPRFIGELQYPTELFDFLKNELPTMEFELIGFENYRLRPEGHERGWTPTWSEVIPIRVIGAIELAGFSISPDQVFKVQEPDVKHAGYGYAGLGKYNPKTPGMHIQDAIAHGAFYWMETHAAVRKSSVAQGERIRRTGQRPVAGPYRRPRKT